MKVAHGILAVVPARSGSKAVRDKNMQSLGGMTLIARAGEVLRRCATVDRAVISTDSAAYAEEGRRHGLDSWFLRPAHLSSDTATAVDTTLHALEEAERHYGQTFGIVLIVEPTSPLRRPQDLDACVHLLVEADVASVVTVSRIDPKYHPRKLLRMDAGRLRYYAPGGESITARQQLDDLYFRNGVCYALRRSLLVEQRQIFADDTLPILIDRPIVNIDGPVELEVAALLLSREPVEETARGSR